MTIDHYEKTAHKRLPKQFPIEGYLKGFWDKFP